MMNTVFFRRFILLFFALSWAFIAWTQPPCDDDDDTSGALSYSGPVCSGGTVTITITLDDDDDDDNELYDVTYSIGGNSFFLNDISGGATVNHTVVNTVTATLISIYDNANDCINVVNSSIVIAVFPQPSLMVSNTSTPGCSQNNGIITVVATGGAPPYQYSLNGGSFQPSGTFSNLGPGSYTVEVVDANFCSDVQPGIILNSANAPVLSISNTAQPGCGLSNGSITATATGGAPPYQYSINGGAFQSGGTFGNLAPGSYSIEVRDANTCSDIITGIVLSSANAPVLGISNTTQPGCGLSNGSITATAAGGAPPYQYSINGGAFQSGGTFGNLAPGSYSIEVRDANACSDIITGIVLSSANAPVLGISNTTQPGCGLSNGSITATATGGAPPYQYSINGGAFQSGGVFAGLPAGSYTITVRDANNCTASSGAIQLNDSGTLQLQVTTSSPANCSQQNGSLTLQAVGGMPPYQYSINGVNYQTSNVFNNLASGSYQVHVRDASGCIAVIPVEIGNTASTLTAATVAAGAITACPGELTVAIGNRPNGTTGVWSSVDPEISFDTPTSPQTVVTAISPGIYTLVWTLSAPGCPAYSSAQVVLVVPQPPVANDDAEQVAAGQSLAIQTILNDDAETGAIFSIIRQPALGFAAIDAATGELDYTPNPNTSGFDTLYYTLCLPPCDGQLCDTAAVVIQVVTEDCSLEADDNVFPEGITPNGDGYNDQLHFVVIDKSTCPYNYARSELIIYNRWGDRVLEASPYDNDWDGGNLPHGVYYYVLKVHLEQEFVKFGNVTIFRD